MPTYVYKTVRSRKQDARLTCTIEGMGSESFYLSRVLYCNYHNLSLEDIKELDVHHIDEDRNNNCKDNLELLTRSEHIKRHPRNPMGKRSDKIKEKFSAIRKQEWINGKYNNKKKRTSKYKEDTESILALVRSGYSQVFIAKQLNIPRTSVQSIIYRMAG